MAPPRRAPAAPRASGSVAASSSKTTRAHPCSRRTRPRSTASERASGLPRLSRKPKRIAATLLRHRLVENGNRQTVELAVRGLRHDLVEDLGLRFGAQQTRGHLTQL